MRKILLSDQFERVHGLTPSDYLLGKSVVRFGKEAHVFNTLDDRDAFDKELARTSHPYSEHYSRVLESPSDIPSALSTHRGDALDVLVGDPMRVAKRLQDLTNELDVRSVANTRPLYRGSKVSPQQLAHLNVPIPFSERKAAASVFAKNSQGEVYTAPKGSVRGLRLADYGVRPMTVGPRRVPEDEWLIDPLSITTSK